MTALLDGQPSFLRRGLAIVLIALGVLFIFLAPETWAGLLLLVLGVSIEVVGMVLRHR